ncbi:MAG: hypothetical protein GX811_07770 [Lentisphaerae bacterium]|nr:hypothetical protein [Lentisphaerota bacterium]
MAIIDIYTVLYSDSSLNENPLWPAKRNSQFFVGYIVRLLEASYDTYCINISVLIWQKTIILIQRADFLSKILCGYLSFCGGT